MFLSQLVIKGSFIAMLPNITDITKHLTASEKMNNLVFVSYVSLCIKTPVNLGAIERWIISCNFNIKNIVIL